MNPEESFWGDGVVGDLEGADLTGCGVKGVGLGTGIKPTAGERDGGCEGVNLEVDLGKSTEADGASFKTRPEFVGRTFMPCDI